MSYTETRQDTEDVLRDLQSNIKHYEDQLAAARVLRDQKIMETHSDGMSMYRIAQVIGISQQAVRNIIRTHK